MSNQPVFVDGGEIPSRRAIYYHSGLDIGGAEELTEVVAATDGLVVSLGDEVLAGQEDDTPISERYDVIYILDRRGWYYRYSHLHSFDEGIELGKRVKIGQPLGQPFIRLCVSASLRPNAYGGGARWAPPV